jgi:hypothetical protein
LQKKGNMSQFREEYVTASSGCRKDQLYFYCNKEGMVVEFTRREFTHALGAIATATTINKGWAADLPAVLADVQAQYYNFLTTLVSSPNVKDPQLVLNNTIVPLDADVNTPYFNQELFRLYADQTYSNPFQNFITPGAMNQSGRFSTLYRDSISIAASQVDQNHPEISQTVADLQSRRSDAQKAFNAKSKEFDDQWAQIAKDRNLTAGTREYTLNYLKWLEDVRYADQMADYSTEIDRLDAQIGALRRSKYTVSESSLLDNLDALDKSMNLARPRYAQTEIDDTASGQKLTDTTLADPHQTPAALFDSSPLILPIADLKAFILNPGGRAFDTLTTSHQISTGSSSWYGSGGGSFLGWGIGGGGSGASSYSTDVSSMKSVQLGFKNIAEIYIDRGQWFNPGVLQDPNIYKLVKTLPQLAYLKYVAVSLFIGRGLTMTLHLGHNASNSDWSTQSINAQGGCSFLGCSFGASGGSSRTSSNFTSNADGATVTFSDGDNVIRVLGARVEPFLAAVRPTAVLNAADSATSNEKLTADVNDLMSGKLSYIEFQKAKIKELAQSQ